MGKVIQFLPKNIDRKLAERLVQLSDQVDHALRDAVEDGADPKEVAGILAHRLGVLLSHIEAKEELWPFCERVAKEQAKLEDF